MKVLGSFVECKEIVYEKKDGTQGKRIECMFAIRNERDTVRVSTWHDKQWCIEHGIKTGASGEMTFHMGVNDHGWYEQALWGFKTQEQINQEEAERKARAEQKPVPMEKTAEMVAAAEQKVQEAQNDPEAGSDLPF